MVTTPGGPFEMDRPSPAEGWALAVRVATAARVLAAALALALTTFVGLAATPVVAVLAVTGLAVGLRLPPAWPPRPSLLSHD